VSVADVFRARVVVEIALVPRILRRVLALSGIRVARADVTLVERGTHDVRMRADARDADVVRARVGVRVARVLVWFRRSRGDATGVAVVADDAFVDHALVLLVVAPILDASHLGSWTHVARPQGVCARGVIRSGAAPGSHAGARVREIAAGVSQIRAVGVAHAREAVVSADRIREVRVAVHPLKAVLIARAGDVREADPGERFAVLALWLVRAVAVLGARLLRQTSTPSGAIVTIVAIRIAGAEINVPAETDVATIVDESVLNTSFARHVVIHVGDSWTV
jgi:hypothetical protein